MFSVKVYVTSLRSDAQCSRNRMGFLNGREVAMVKPYRLRLEATVSVQTSGSAAERIEDSGK